MKRPPRRRSVQKLDAKALQILKKSGILNPNVTLDQLMDLSRKLNHLMAKPEAFIYRDFIFIDP
jgi:hypothetical protein